MPIGWGTSMAFFSGWTHDQRNAVIASFLGWTLDAFDFFLMVFCLRDIATEFGVAVTDVTVAILLTLAMRPVGALVFGRLADRFGRRPILMIDILLLFGAGIRLRLRAEPDHAAGAARLFGVAMGGEWGVGASLTMETIPPQARGFVSGLLQAGYPDRLSPGLDRVLPVLPLDRLARPVHGRRRCRRCWCCTSAATCRNPRPGLRVGAAARLRGSPVERGARVIGGCRLRRSC